MGDKILKGFGIIFLAIFLPVNLLVAILFILPQIPNTPPARLSGDTGSSGDAGQSNSGFEISNLIGELTGISGRDNSFDEAVQYDLSQNDNQSLFNDDEILEELYDLIGWDMDPDADPLVPRNEGDISNYSVITYLVENYSDYSYMPVITHGGRFISTDDTDSEYLGGYYIAFLSAPGGGMAPNLFFADDGTVYESIGATNSWKIIDNIS